jgi:hypothetical protein
MDFRQIRDRVDIEARELKPHLLALTIVTAVLFALGWLVGVAFRGVWLVVAWALAAAKVGFNAGRGKGDG